MKRSVRSQPCHLRDGRQITLLDLATTSDIHAMGSASQTRHCYSHVSWPPLEATSKNGTPISPSIVWPHSHKQNRGLHPWLVISILVKGHLP